MRDDRNRWDAQSDHLQSIEIGGVTLHEVVLERQMLVSGALVREAFTPAVAWPDIAQGDGYTLSLRRDRVMVVNGVPLPEGWDGKAAQAVSNVTDGFRVFEIAGEHAMAVLQRGAELEIKYPSASVARGIFHLSCILYRHEQKDRFRIHVARGHGEGLYQNLIAAMEAAAEHVV